MNATQPLVGTPRAGHVGLGHAAVSGGVSRPPAGKPAMNLLIDWTRCDGHGLCAALLPRSVQLDDWGYPMIDASGIARESVPDLKRAVSACPALALRLAR
jgi:ferredoxin